MSGFWCICGAFVDEGRAPLPNGYVMFSEEAFDSAIDVLAFGLERLAASGEATAQRVRSIVDELWTRDSGIMDAVRCESCGRLHIFSGGPHPPRRHTQWIPETPGVEP
jgi:hypothetical protein